VERKNQTARVPQPLASASLTDEQKGALDKQHCRDMVERMIEKVRIVAIDLQPGFPDGVESRRHGSSRVTSAAIVCGGGLDQCLRVHVLQSSS
jgi:hypothetical protein